MNITKWLGYFDNIEDIITWYKYFGDPTEAFRWFTHSYDPETAYELSKEYDHPYEAKKAL